MLETVPPGTTVTRTDKLGSRPIGQTPMELHEEYVEEGTDGTRVFFMGLGMLAVAAGMFAGSTQIEDPAGGGANAPKTVLEILSGVPAVIGLGQVLLGAWVYGRQPYPSSIPEFSLAFSKPGYVAAERNIRMDEKLRPKMYIQLAEEEETRALREKLAMRDAEARARRVVAIMPLRLPTRIGDQEVKSQISEYLVAAVLKSSKFKVVPSEQLLGAVRETKAKSYDACFDESCQIELGKAVAAELMISGAVLQVGDACALTLTLYDLRAEASHVGAAIRTACDASGLLDAVDKAAAAL